VFRAFIGAAHAHRAARAAGRLEPTTV
jgi:hypothetical protein